MKSTPILFNADMVRALLIGAKTQTRRVMKVQPPSAEYKLSTCIDTTGNKKDKGRQHWITIQDQYSIDDSSQPYFSCPFGYAGDQLWVRETFQPIFAEGVTDLADIDYKTGEGYAPIYPATDKVAEFVSFYGDITTRCTPSIHMPRWASRLNLEITKVRVERLNDISEEDALAEGIEGEFANYKDYTGDVEGFAYATGSYRTLWESINGEGSWAANPWVWVIEFEVLK